MLLRFLYPKHRDKMRKTFFRNFIFGVEDSLVSTVGLLSGIAAANTPRATIITSGVILIFVEAFSMGVGSFLSEETAEESSKKAFSRTGVAQAAVIMFVSYFVAGFIPLAPYVFVTGPVAETYSILASLIALTLLGAFSARWFKGKVLAKAIEMLVLGGLATLIGIAVGSILKV